MPTVPGISAVGPAGDVRSPMLPSPEVHPSQTSIMMAAATMADHAKAAKRPPFRKEALGAKKA